MIHGTPFSPLPNVLFSTPTTGIYSYGHTLDLSLLKLPGPRISSSSLPLPGTHLLSASSLKYTHLNSTVTIIWSQKLTLILRNLQWPLSTLAFSHLNFVVIYYYHSLANDFSSLGNLFVILAWKILTLLPSGTYTARLAGGNTAVLISRTLINASWQRVCIS